MPLTEFQANLARALSENRSFDSYLAGGAAILIEPKTTRFSRDLDYFHDSEERVVEAFDADRRLLERRGYSVEVNLNQPGYIRAVVAREREATKVEWAQDSAWRFMPTMKDERVGWVLHPVDLAVNKVLALAGREEPRDLLDVLYIHEHVLVLGALCWAACGKDPGFTPLSLLELLRRRGQLRGEDLDRLDLAEPLELPLLKKSWLQALDSVKAFVASRPSPEVGCLYYSAAEHAFVDPGAVDPAFATEVRPHFGRPGGVLPRVADS
ncbi:MAG: nucleotidyl transferase AbiEii/AbiGii toxin family protein [Thermoanaerobaculia bacterium]